MGNQEKQIVVYEINQAEIAKMSDIYMSLTIDDLYDRDQFEAVHSARMVMRGHRLRADKTRKAANKKALDFVRDNNKNCGVLTDQMDPIEDHLKTEEKKVIDEKKRVEAKKAEALRVATQARVEALQAVDKVVSFNQAGSYTEKDFKIFLGDETQWYQERKDRLAREAADRKAEDERLETVRKKQKDEAEKLRKAQKAIDEEKAGLKALLKAEADRKQAAPDRLAPDKAQKKETGRILEEKKVESEKQAKIDKKVADEKEKECFEASRPDREKLVKFGNELLAITGPVLDDFTGELHDILDDALDTIDHVAERLMDL